jgi:hypothetical protein
LKIELDELLLSAIPDELTKAGEQVQACETRLYEAQRE